MEETARATKLKSSMHKLDSNGSASESSFLFCYLLNLMHVLLSLLIEVESVPYTRTEFVKAK